MPGDLSCREQLNLPPILARIKMCNNKPIWVINRCEARNIGDRLIGKSLVSAIEKKGYRAKLIEYTGRPLSSCLCRSVLSFYSHLPFISLLRRHIRIGARILAAVWGSANPSLIIIGGGQLLQNNSKFPQAMLAWTLISVFKRVPLVFFSVGVERINGNFSWLDKYSLRLATTIATDCYVRDNHSRCLLKQVTKKEFKTIPDAVALIKYKKKEPDNASTILVYVSKLKKRQTDLQNRPRDRETYYAKIEDKLRYWVSKGAPIVITVSSSGDVEEAKGFKDWLLSRYPDSSVSFNQPRAGSQLLENIRSAKLVIATRMHPMIFAYLMDIPFIVIALNAKTDSMTKQIKEKSPQSMHRHVDRALESVLRFRIKDS